MIASLLALTVILTTVKAQTIIPDGSYCGSALGIAGTVVVTGSAFSWNIASFELIPQQFER